MDIDAEQRELQRVLGFSDEDLAANQAGYLTESQVIKARRKLRADWLLQGAITFLFVSILAQW